LQEEIGGLIFLRIADKIRKRDLARAVGDIWFKIPHLIRNPKSAIHTKNPLQPFSRLADINAGENYTV